MISSATCSLPHSPLKLSYDILVGATCYLLALRGNTADDSHQNTPVFPGGSVPVSDIALNSTQGAWLADITAVTTTPASNLNDCAAAGDACRGVVDSGTTGLAIPTVDSFFVKGAHVQAW